MSRDDAPTLLTVAQAATILGVHPNTIRTWTDAGRLTAYRINSRGDRRFRRGDVERLLVEDRPGRRRPDLEARCAAGTQRRARRLRPHRRRPRLVADDGVGRPSGRRGPAHGARRRSRGDLRQRGASPSSSPRTPGSTSLHPSPARSTPTRPTWRSRCPRSADRSACSCSTIVPPPGCRANSGARWRRWWRRRWRARGSSAGPSVSSSAREPCDRSRRSSPGRSTSRPSSARSSTSRDRCSRRTRPGSGWCRPPKLVPSRSLPSTA